jgi:hypothetical protein
MRARAVLAATLWRLGWREEAVEHQRERADLVSVRRSPASVAHT